MKIFKQHEAIDHIIPYLPKNPVIIEAGAFDGKDTAHIAQRLPHATIHAFEPVPDIFKRLECNTKHLPNVHRYQIALSNHVGTAQLHIGEKPHKPGIPTQASSLHAPKERLDYSTIRFPRSIEVPTTTIDAWAKQYSIRNVDCLWLDMQGHELTVMHASPHTMKQVSVVFTEVAFIEGYEGQPLMTEVISWLEGKGFSCVGRDFEETQSWFFGNVLFVRT